MTGSPLIAGMHQVLAEFFATSTKGDASRSGGSDDGVVWQHHELVAAIRDRDIDRARSMIRLHFRGLSGLE
jgi:DNA-binding FadR family transcriptional regulator